MREPDWDLIHELFERAVDLDPDALGRFLDDECEDDEVRRLVERLLKANREPLPLLDASPPDMASLLPGEDPASGEYRDGLPETVGPYRIEKLIGRGGMGVVLLAERPDLPRKVALKLLRERWVDSVSLRRFKREQATLARLQHPNIARLLDSGSADDGTPFLTMDYIDGEPITSYCNNRGLSVGERLKLFLDVCSAVEFAHQNLVVHRDLKPSNIFVDESGTVKLLDFGISKLLESDEDEVLTKTANRMLTPSYASPEQLLGNPISTASDVYSLGVVLFDLLTGKRPFDLAGRSPTEVSQIVLEETPRRPSTVVKDPSRQRRLRGDLDNIVIKSLEKEPGRRYASVEALRTDIERHRNGLPVEAREAKLPYRVQKFVKRHRWGVSVSTGTIVLLLVTAIAMVYQQAETAHERDRAAREAARAERTVEFLTGLFEASDPEVALGDTITARQLLERGLDQAESLQDQPLLQAETYDIIGNVYASLGQFGRAVELLEKSVEIRRSVVGDYDLELASTLRDLALLFSKIRDTDRAVKTAVEALRVAEELTDPPSVAIGRSLNSLGLALEAAGQLAPADSVLEAAHEMLVLGKDSVDSEVTLVLANRAAVLTNLGRVEESVTVAEQVLNWRRRHLPQNHPEVAEAVDHLAVSLRRLGRYDEARPLYEESLSIKRQVYGDSHPSTARTMLNLAIFLGIQGRYAEAEPYFIEAVDGYAAAYGAESPRTAGAMSAYAVLLGRVGKYSESVPLYRRALRIEVVALGARHPAAINTRLNLGLGLARTRQFDEAFTHIRQAAQYRLENEDHEGFVVAFSNLGLQQATAGFAGEGEVNAREALAYAEKHLGTDHSGTTLARSVLGRTFVEAGRYELADSVLTDALKRYLEEFPMDSPSAMAMVDALGRAKMNIGAYAASDSLLRRSYAYRLDRLGTDHPWTIETAAHLEELRARRLEAAQ